VSNYLFLAAVFYVLPRRLRNDGQKSPTAMARIHHLYASDLAGWYKYIYQDWPPDVHSMNRRRKSWPSIEAVRLFYEE
jgi:hypothetical protein